MNSNWFHTCLVKSLFALLSLWIVLGAYPVSGQTINTSFGKNRVQYNDDFSSWWMYETEHFVTFWYGKGRNIAKSVIQLAELDHDEIQGLLAHSMNDKIRIVIYLDLTDYNQTNIAYWENREAGGAGLASFYDNKVIVYFDGNHQNLRKQIRAGIVKAYLNSMFSGISIQDIYYDLMSTELPAWFVTGLVDYVAAPWPPEKEEMLRFFFQEKSRKIKRFKRFARDYPELAGHSLWSFLADQYGREALSDFLYLVRIHQNVDKAFRYVYGIDDKEIYRNWYAYYDGVFSNRDFEGPLDAAAFRVKPFDHPVTRTILDPSGDTLYYAANQSGRVRVMQRILSDGTEKPVMKYGFKNAHQLPDLKYPLLSYDDSGSRLGLIYERRDRIYFRSYDPVSLQFSEVLFPESVQRIYSFSFEKPGFLVFSGSLDGFSDIYQFDLEKRVIQRFTEAYFDEGDLIRTRVDGTTAYLVSSNHETMLTDPMEYDSFPPLGNRDIFMADEIFSQSRNLTKTPDRDEVEILPLAKGEYLLLGDSLRYSLPEWWSSGQDGQIFRKTILAGKHQILSHDFKNDRYVFTYRVQPDRWYLAATDQLGTILNNPRPDPSGFFETPQASSLSARDNDAQKQVEEQAFFEIDQALQFQTRFTDPEPEESLFSDPVEALKPNAIVAKNEKNALPVFNSSRAVASRLRFSFSELVTRVDNELLFEGMESYNGINNQFSPPPTGFLVKTTVRDLFEDHLLEGGIRLAADFRGMEYFLSYHNLKKKLDHSYTFYRKASVQYDHITELDGNPDKIRNRTNLVQYRVKYPFDTYRSLQATATLRFDQTILAASNLASLNTPGDQKQRILLGLEYIFDNTSQKSANLLSGTRYKAFAQLSNTLGIRLSSPVQFDLSEGLMGVVGFDVRHYLDIFEFSTLALRLAGQGSFGSEKNIYFLGAVENWYFGYYDDSYPIPKEENFAFLVQAANVRGFPYNIRNGSSFALANLEYRIPVFSYFYQGHSRYAFIRDFQLTAFFDTGMAWYGLTPFSEKNEANVYYVEAPPAIVLKIKQFNDPLVAGMGFGLRTTLFGYFVKLDYAWGIQSGRIGKPLLYFSVGLDF